MSRGLFADPVGAPINFSYESGAINNQSSVYRTNIIDTQFYVKVTTTGSVTWTAGNLLYGATSGAVGFVVSGSGTTGFLYETNGVFLAGEVLKTNNSSGSTFATIASGGVRNYGFGDVKSYAFNSGGGTADAVLDI